MSLRTQNYYIIALFHRIFTFLPQTHKLCTVAKNVAISFYRKNTNRQNSNVSLIDEYLPIQEEVNSEKQEQLDLLEHFISELNNLDKALMLLFLEDKSHTEISEILGLSVSNVGTKVGRIKEKLKKKFSQRNSQ